MSDKPMRYRDSEGGIWETVPGTFGDELTDEGGTTRSYDHVLSQYGPLTLVHDDEPAEGSESTPTVGPVYESLEELAAEIARLRTDNASLTAARDRARRDRDDWREAYNTLCSDLAYEMGMEDASIAGDREVKARVAELVKESARSTGRCGSFGHPTLNPAGGPAPSPPVCALPAGHAGWHRGDDAEWNDPEPTPRDGDLTRLLRDAMKRYGVPAVMAEAGRLAQQRL